MADVIAFPSRLRVACSEIAQQQASEAQDLLNSLMIRAAIACPSCSGRGHMLYKHPATGLLATAPCPCGGTDEDRIDLNDFGGAA